MVERDPAVVAVEQEIDEAIQRSELRLEIPPQAIWSILSVIDNAHFKDMMNGEKVQFRHGNFTQVISRPLRCFLSTKKKFAGGAVNLGRGLETQAMAADWIHRCLDYQGFEVLFPLWYLDKIAIKLEGKRLIVEDSTAGDPYDAYNVTIADEGGLVADRRGSINIEELAPNLTKSVQRIGEDYFTVAVTSRMVDKFSEAVLALDWTLPEGWDFGNFKVGTFKKVYVAIQALALIWLVARVISWHKGVHMISGLCHLPIKLINSLLHRSTGVDLATVKVITELLTFGSRGIQVPNALLQPLFVTDDGQCFVAPILLFNTNPENNLCGLVNRIDPYKKIYSTLSNTKESLMRREAKGRLEALGLEVSSGSIDSTDVDLAIIDRAKKACLCVELKWFIGPTSIGECHLRSKDLAVGIAQAKKVSVAHAVMSPSFVRVANVDNTFEFLAIVASMNWIGNSEHQDPDVPIVKFRHLLDKIEECGLIAVTAWLRNRAYLPVKDVNFQCFEEEIRCAGWESKVGRFRRIE